MRSPELRNTARIGQFVFVDESAVARVSIDNKETAFFVAKIRVASGNLHVLRNSQIIFWIPTDQKAMFFYSELFSFDRSARPYQYSRGGWQRAEEKVQEGT